MAVQSQPRSMTGWIGFAAMLLVIIGSIDIFQGLIAIIRGEYYAITPNQIIVFDMKSWGWITLIWGIVAILAGVGLASGAGWARWFAILIAFLSIFEQLAFVGSAQYTLWALMLLTLTVLVLFALLARWSDFKEARLG